MGKENSVKWLWEYGLYDAYCPHCDARAYEKDHCIFCKQPYEWCDGTENFDLEKAKAFFERKYHYFNDNFGFEKYPDEIKSIKIAIQLIEKELKNGD